MKQNLHQRFLGPFIGFVIVLTLLVITWSSVLLFNYFKAIEFDSLDVTVSQFHDSFVQVDKANRYIHSLGYSQSISQRYLSVMFPESDINELFSFNTLDRDEFDSIEQSSYVEHDAKKLIFKYKSGPRKKPYLTSFNVDKYFSSFSHEPYSVGVFYQNNFSSFTTIYANRNLSKDEKAILYQQYRLFLDDKVNQIDIKSMQLTSFFIDEQYPNIVFFVSSKDTSFVFLLLKVALGLLAAILVSTSGIFFIYLMTLKKMKTSIDVLSSVSKKVAKGNFNEKVFIYSEDEIGELSQSFNLMIEKLKESTETIIRQKDQSDAIIACIPDGVIVTNFENKLIIANKKAEDIFGFQSQHNYLTQIDYCIDHPAFQEHSKILKKQSSFNSEFVFQINPVKQILNMTSTVVFSANDIPIGMVYLIRDVTHEKQIEELREGFLRTVSHELRTPLTSVIGFIELVQNSGVENLSNEQKSCLETAFSEASSLKVLINDLLELSQMQSEQPALNYSTFNLYDFVNDIITRLSPLSKGKKLQLINSVQRKNLEIVADEIKLRRVFINLISNGIKFTPSGFVKVSCVELDDCIEFCISDTGIGLKSSEQDVIFEKFRQIDYSSKREYQGIGLGLSIVKELVELHKGSIRVESVVEKGSNFYFTIEKKRDLTATVVS